MMHQADWSLYDVQLTPRQRQVVEGFAAGLTTKEVAVRIGRSVKTVEYHREKVYKRIKANNIVAMVKYALRNGLTSL